MFSGVFTGEEVDEAGDQGSEDTTTVNVQTLLEDFLKMSLISVCFIVELFAGKKSTRNTLLNYWIVRISGLSDGRLKEFSCIVN